MWIDDNLIKRCSEDIALSVWIPRDTMVVLGSSNDPKRECFTDKCELDKISIVKRYGGGGAVVLHPGVLVISLGLWVKSYYQNANYFKKINQAVIQTLSDCIDGLESLGQAGISDLVLDEKKIAGTSMFRSRNYLLYQASILIDSKIDLIERYLCHPSREPDYRKQKNHRDFLIGLKNINENIEINSVQKYFTKYFIKRITFNLADELITSKSEQCKHLMTNKLGLSCQT